MNSRPNSNATSGPSRTAGRRPGERAPSEQNLNMSMADVPADWIEAQQASPIGAGDNAPLRKPARFAVVPTGHGSTFITNLLALCAAFVTGAAWYILDVTGTYAGPWTAVGVGLVIAICIHVAGGGDAPYRAALALACYLATLVVVLVLVAHADLTGIYGAVDGLRQYETTVARTRLTDPLHLVAYTIGGLVAATVAYSSRRG